MADAHHDAARGDERCGREPELLGAQQRADHDVAAGAQAAVDLQADAPAQRVADEHLLGLGEAELPGHAGVADRRGGGGAGAAVHARDHDVIGAGLGDARGHGADARERDQLDADLGGRVDAAQVVDQLGEILDRVDVVMRRRRDQTDAGRRMAQTRDLDVDLVAGQLAALAGLGALRDLDLEHVGVDEVAGRDAEARRGDLLDRGAPRVAVGVERAATRVLAALAAVGAAAEPVERDRERLVRLLRDRSERHRARCEAAHDLARGLDLVERHGWPGRHELHEPAQRAAEAVLLVGGDREGGVALGALVAHRALQRGDDLGVPDVALAAQAVAVDTARIELAARPRVLVAAPDVGRDALEADAADARRRTREVARDDVGRQPDALEQLRAAIRHHGRDAHLGEHLEQALADGLHVLRLRVLGRLGADLACGPLGGHEIERDVRVDGGGAEADEQGEVHDLARLARLHDQAAAGAPALAYEVAVHRRGGEQGGDRRGVGRTGAAVGEHEDLLAQRDRARGAPAECVERPLERAAAAAGVERAVERDGAEAVARQRAQLREVAARQHRLRHRQAAGVVGRLVEQVALRADGRAEAHHERLALGVDRGVRDLGEELLEEAAQQPRALRERGQRRVDAHRRERLLAVARHRHDDLAQLLVGVAEHAQIALERLLRGRLDGRRRDVLEVDLLLVEQRAVGAAARERALDLVVAADAPGVGVDDQHLAGLEAVVDDDLGGIEVEHARLRREHEQPVARHLVAARAQPVAVERGAGLPAVAERDRGRAVPRLEHAGVELVERAQVVGHRRGLAPGGRDQHRERVRRRAAGEHEQLERGVERGRVAPAVVDQREQLGEVVAELRRAQLRLARVHPLHVAAHRVDLAVVREVVERMREIPRAERVGREARVHERHRRLDLGLAQIGVVARQLVGAEQALVGQRAARERGDVERRLRHAASGRGELDAPADHGQLAAERALVAGRALRDEQLAHHGLALAREPADGARVARHVAPAERLLPLLDRDAHAQLLAAQPQGRIVREEAHGDGVVAGRRQLELELRAREAAEQAVGHLQHQPGAVARVGIGSARAAMLHRGEHRERALDHLAAALRRLPVRSGRGRTRHARSADRRAGSDRAPAPQQGTTALNQVSRLLVTD